MVQQYLYKLTTCKLRTLVRIQDLSLAKVDYSLFKHFYAEIGLQGIGYASADNKAAVKVYNSNQVHEVMFHRYVGDIHVPHLIRQVNFQIQ